MATIFTQRTSDILNPTIGQTNTQYQQSADRVYGKGERTEYNPFLNKAGQILNPYISDSTYQKLLDSDKTSAKVKEYINKATGLSPTAVQNKTGEIYSAADPSNSAEPEGFSFNAGADENNLAALDVATELPKLSSSQISAIISKHFGNSSVIKPSDAEGIYNAQQKTGMSALAILGIGALESGYGTSNIAKQKNNLWGWNATNSNPGANATSFSQMSEGALQYAQKYMNTYYNNYGAKTINSAGTGNNPAGKGYAYNNDGSISTTWASSINNIMKNFYQTAKSVPNASYTSGGSGSSNKAVSIAKQFLGTPYVWGGTTPKGFDCSGLMQYVYKQMGVDIPRVSQDQFKSGTAVDKAQLQPGDLVFFKGATGSASAPGHVGMYIGGGQFIQAPKTGDVVKISDLSSRGDYVGARRYTN